MMELNIPEFPYKGTRVALEYVFVNNSKFQFMSKLRVVDAEPKTIEECPIWDCYNWNDDEGKELLEMIMKPVAMFEHPFLRSPNKIVLCDFWKDLDTPSYVNTRPSCVKTMKRLKYDPDTKHRPTEPHEPWFGIEQEYFVTGEDGVPISYDPKNNNYESLIIYAKVGHPHDKNVGLERELANRHLMACLYAGVRVAGLMRENGPSQWEYQVGPCEGVSIGDHLHVSRFILLRLAELFGLRVTFKPMPVKDEAFSSGGHVNFSTRKMRREGGMKYIKHAVDILSKSDQKPLLQMYDPTLTRENDERLSNTRAHWHPRQNDFFFDIANKEFTTIRIPKAVQTRGYGYFEDRRGSSQIDPYAAAEGIVRASIFGDFLKPGYESLKDLLFWDS